MNIKSPVSDPYIMLWPNADILMHNNLTVGIIISNEEVSKYEFLVLLTDRLDLSLEDSIKIAQSANRLGRKVVLVPSLESRRQPEFLPSILQSHLLKEYAKHSQDDVKTAVLAGRGNFESLVDYDYAAIAYSYNQILTTPDSASTEVHHAEAILAEFLKVINFQENHLWWLMLLEPCQHCLKDMVASNSDVISYYNDHKAKWNTPEYLALKNELIQSDKIRYVKEIIVE